MSDNDVIGAFAEAITNQPLVYWILVLCVILLLMVIVLWPVWKVLQIRKEKRAGDRGTKRRVVR